ncbi:MAG TPA: methyltransferase domain-containing protein [Polyangiaceae bacterium]|nr:methyltransferase domain-containing protein [Polyangiaceae bacterium]
MLLTIIGIFFGISVAANVHALSGEPDGHFAVWAAAGAVGGVGLLFGLRAWVRRRVRSAFAGSPRVTDYERRDTMTYSTFLLALAGWGGARVSVPAAYLLAAAFCAAQALHLYFTFRRDGRGGAPSPTGRLTLLFLVSGMAALVYEIAWQKALFAAFGVNIESITIVVSLFMFGLGVGSLVGGYASQKLPRRLPHLFVACEAAIGLFGLASLPLIDAVASRTLHLSLAGVTWAVYALLGLPTMLMGATLPVLVTYLQRHYKNVGRSVGRLYFVNTLGAALACLLTVDVLFVFVGKQAVVAVAAGLNFLVAGLAAAHVRRLGRGAPAGEAGRLAEAADEGRAGGVDEGAPPTPARRLSLPLPLVLVVSALTGYFSLSQQILWVRAVGYQAQGAPQAFGHTLGVFLLGLAFGARRGERFCSRGRGHPLTYLAGLLLLGAVVYHASVPLFAQANVASKAVGLLASYALVGVVAFLFGNVLPVISHFGIAPDGDVGRRLSWIYAANVVGATAGPLLTGMVLLDRYTLQQNVLFLSVAPALLAALLYLAAPSPPRAKAGLAGLSLAAAAALAVTHEPSYDRLFEKLRYGPRVGAKPRHRRVLQNRSGVIAVEPDEQAGDVIFGGGAYDGRFSLDPGSDTNGIRRAYMIAALHPDPAEVLEIGLSSGSWTWALAAYDKVRRLTVVEINPGYPEVIKDYDARHRSVLTNPKVELAYDDGRRWLNRHPDRAFDFILMNTTFHWRANITNLVSQEFLTLAKRHLKPGGVIYYNATGSDDVAYTAARVFRHVTRFGSFVAASDRPFALDEAEKRANFARFLDAGRPVLDPEDPRHRAALGAMLRADLTDVAPALLGRGDLRLITDDNMLTEFKRVSDKNAFGYLYRVYDPDVAWPAFRNRLLTAR